MTSPPPAPSGSKLRREHTRVHVHQVKAFLSLKGMSLLVSPEAGSPLARGKKPAEAGSKSATMGETYLQEGRKIASLDTYAHTGAPLR